jgi:hypothetical protein
VHRLKEKVQGVVAGMRPIQPTIPEFPSLRRPPADLLRTGLPSTTEAVQTAYSDSPPGQVGEVDDDAWDDDEADWEPDESEATAEPRTTARAALPPPASKGGMRDLAHQKAHAAPQSDSTEPNDDDEWEPDDDDSAPDVAPAQLVRSAAGRTSDRPPASRDELSEEFFSTPPEPEPADFSDIDSLAAAAIKIDPKRQEMARKVVIGVMSSMAFLLVVSAGIAALGSREDPPSAQAAPSAVHGNLSAAAELAASRAPSTITYQRAEAEAARQQAETTKLTGRASDSASARRGRHASPEDVAAYRRAIAKKKRLKAAKRRPRPTGSSGGMFHRF